MSIKRDAEQNELLTVKKARRIAELYDDIQQIADTADAIYAGATEIGFSISSQAARNLLLAHLTDILDELTDDLTDAVEDTL